MDINSSTQNKNLMKYVRLQLIDKFLKLKVNKTKN